MALDPRKRQKKAEQRKAKQKERQLAFKKQELRRADAALEAAMIAPILHCFVMDELWEQGMGQVVLSRELPGHRVVFSAFLLDAYCLGVKNAMHETCSRSDYNERIYDRLNSNYDLDAIKPEFARYLVEAGVEYARDLGFAPHPDYAKARLIFGDIVADRCDNDFEFGKDGKPFFVAGPNDGPLRCQQIMRTLAKRCGDANYHFMMPGAQGNEMDVMEEIEDETQRSLENAYSNMARRLN